MSTTTFVADQRLVVGSPAVLRWQPSDSEGEPTAPSGTVTVAVVRSDGTAVLASGTATTTVGTAATVTVPLAQALATDVLTATWSVDGLAVAQTTAELVGGVYVSATEVRAMDDSLSNAAKYPTTLIQAARAEVEAMFEDAARRAFVPRFRVDLLTAPGARQIVVRRPDVRSVRWAREIRWDGNEYPIDVTDLEVSSSGVVTRWGSAPWPPEPSKVRIGYEYGLASPPADLKRAIVAAIRVRLNTFKTAVPDRAVSFTQIEGGTVQLATPGTYGWITGVPEIDESLKRYKFHTAGIA